MVGGAEGRGEGESLSSPTFTCTDSPGNSGLGNLLTCEGSKRSHIPKNTDQVAAPSDPVGVTSLAPSPGSTELASGQGLSKLSLCHQPRPCEAVRGMCTYEAASSTMEEISVLMGRRL